MVHRCRACWEVVFSTMATATPSGGPVPAKCPRRLTGDPRFGSAWACAPCQAKGHAPTGRPRPPAQGEQRDPEVDW
jgi:hypothetical protein